MLNSAPAGRGVPPHPGARSPQLLPPPCPAWQLCSQHLRGKGVDQGVGATCARGGGSFKPHYATELKSPTTPPKHHHNGLRPTDAAQGGDGPPTLGEPGH